MSFCGIADPVFVEYALCATTAALGFLIAYFIGEVKRKKYVKPFYR